MTSLLGGRFLSALIDHAFAAFAADPRRISIFGTSNGGGSADTQITCHSPHLRAGDPTSATRLTWGAGPAQLQVELLGGGVDITSSCAAARSTLLSTNFTHGRSVANAVGISS